MNLLQTSITNPMLLAHYLFGGLLILMQIPWYHREQNLLQMKNQTNALHGEKMDWWDVISDQLWNTLGVVKK